MATQDEWYRCSKCYGLYFEGNPGSGVCSAPPTRLSGTSHLSDPSMVYTLQCNETSTPAGGQQGWRWCRKCEGLWFAGDLPAGASGGRCPADPVVSQDPNYVFGHIQAGTYHYILLANISPSANQQGGWWYCWKCRGLWFGRDNAHGGDCPRDTSRNIEEGHVHAGSGRYVLTATSIHL